MSHRNKGTFGATIKITREPDRSGNYVCNGTNDNVEFQLAVDDVIVRGGGKIMIGPGTYTLGDEVLFDGNTFAGGYSYEPEGTILVNGCKYSTIINTAENAYGFRIVNGCSVHLSDLKFEISDNNGQPAIYGDATGGATSQSLLWGGLHNIRVRGGSNTVGLYAIHLQSPIRWYWSGDNHINVEGIGTGVNFSCGICIENEDAVLARGDGHWSGHFNVHLDNQDNVGFYFWGSGANGGQLKSHAWLFVGDGGPNTGTTAFKIDNFDHILFDGWGYEECQFGWVIDNAEDVRIVSGGYVQPGDNGIVFDVNSTNKRIRVEGVDIINVTGTRTVTVMDDDVVGTGDRSLYDSLYVNRATGATVNWLPHTRTAITRTCYKDFTTTKWSEEFGTEANVADGGNIAISLIDTPTAYFAQTTVASEMVGISAVAWNLLTCDIKTDAGGAGTQQTLSYGAWWRPAIRGF